MRFGPISTLPSYIPTMFGMTGQAIPKEFEGFIQPTLDVMDFLSTSNSLEVFGTANVLCGGRGFFPDPNMSPAGGEAWLVHGASVQADTGAAEFIRIQLCSARATSASWVGLRELGAETSSNQAGAVGLGHPRSSCRSWFILKPGDTLACSVPQITTAGNIALQFQAAIFRFKV